MRKAHFFIPVVAMAAMVALMAVRAKRSGIGVQREAARGPAESGALFRFPADASAKGERAQLAALSLTASDGTGLTLASYDARGVIEGPLAFTEVRLAFDNPEARTLEGTFRITLPQGAAISRFAMRQGESWQEGEVVEKQAARRAYEDFLHRRQDPALLEQAAGNEFSARVFPIPPHGRKELVVSYSQELGPEAPYAMTLRGLPRVTKLDAIVSRTGDDASILGQIHLENAAPDRDLVIDPATLGAGDGVRAGELVLLRVQPAAQAGADPLGATVVMIDTSASRALGFEAEIELVDGIVAGMEPSAPILVAAFDQGIDVIHEGTASGWAAVGGARLRERRALGASDLDGALAWAQAKASSIKAKRVVLVTDGVPTKGTIEPAPLRERAKGLGAVGVERIDAVAVGGIRDDALLRGITTAGLARDGVVIDGSRGATAALRRLAAATRSVTVKVEGASFQWPERLDGVQPGDEALVYAEVPRGTAPRVRIGEGATVEPKLAQIDRPLLERAWAQARIAALVAKGDPSTSKEEIVRLSTTHRVLSPYTALLVLETEADYARYKIDRRALADILTIEGTKLARRKRTEDQPLGTIDPRVPPKTVDSDGVVTRAPAAPRAVENEAPAGAAPAATAMPAAASPQAREFGMIGLLNSGGGGDPNAPTAPWGRDDSQGSDPLSARGNMWGSEIGDAFGAGGLGLSGIGESGGGVSGIGHGAGTGTGQGFGSGSGRLGGSHMIRPPRLRMGETRVSGRLPPEVVTRIVRQNFGRFRLCYEEGLRRNPVLQGRVAVRFEIGRDGSVAHMSNGGSDLPDAAVINCIVRGFAGLSFPQPEGGTVNVVVPIHFSNDGEPSRSDRGTTPPPSAPPSPPQPSVGPYEGKLGEVMDALAHGDKDGALAKAIGFWKASPGDVLALVALGEAFEAKGEVRSAARAYGSIIDLFASRADLRRMAGERLERLEPTFALGLAADSYEKAVAQRPDHPAGHRLLAYARLRSGDVAGAFAAIEAGATRTYPSGRFAGVDRILREDMGLLGAAWIKQDPSKAEEVRRRLSNANATLDTTPSVRFVLVWETDNNDVDFHIHDGQGGHAFYGSKELPSGGSLYADVTTGYGPECFTVPLAAHRRAPPYRLQAHYYARGPMGYGMGKLEILEHDGHGGLTFEERPFVVMQDRAFVELGSYPAAKSTGKKAP
ncbi:Hypothetical protein A7982_04587 [Minicystis rosea]|nr:Hypothetical protein A7982_04587 [Minicystis rosea]